MILKITSKRRVTLPAPVLEALGVGPGDRLELVERSDGFHLRPQRIHHERLAPLRGKLRKGHGPFEIETFRSQAHEPALRY